MLLSDLLFIAAALIWPLRRIVKAEGRLLPFLSVLAACAAVFAGLLNDASLAELAPGPLIGVCAALLFSERRHEK